MTTIGIFAVFLCLGLPIIFLLLLAAFVFAAQSDGTVLSYQSVAALFVAGALAALVPVLLPVAAAFEIDPIHFGVVLSVAALTGLVSPPVGPGLYIAMDATGLGMVHIFRSALPFLVAFLLSLLIVNLLPFLSTWLPMTQGL